MEPRFIKFELYNALLLVAFWSQRVYGWNMIVKINTIRQGSLNW